jgi:RNA polymerase-associated protein CTR9
MSCDKLKVVKQANDFIGATLKLNANDLYHLCAYGWLQYTMAREERGQTEEAAAEKTKMINRALSSFSTVLEKDPASAMAAQGIAIIVAEDILKLNESQSRMNAMEALGILNKVKETMNDGSVYINMGHCHYTRDELEKAIECVSFVRPALSQNTCLTCHQV